jgi:hypothetical protein
MVEDSKGEWTANQEQDFNDLTARREAGKDRLAVLVKKVVSKAFNVDTLVERFIEYANDIRDALEPFDTRSKGDSK